MRWGESHFPRRSCKTCRSLSFPSFFKAFKVVIKTNKGVFLLGEAPPDNDLKLLISALWCSVIWHCCADSNLNPLLGWRAQRNESQRCSWYKKKVCLHMRLVFTALTNTSKNRLQSCVCFHTNVVLKDYVKTKTAGQWCSASSTCNVEIKEHTYYTIITFFSFCH